MQKTITLGELTLSIQSFIVAVVGIFASLVLAVFVRPIAGAMTLLAFFVAAYNVNCTLVGQCTVWAWTLTGLYGLYVVLILASIILRSSLPKISNANVAKLV